MSAAVLPRYPLAPLGVALLVLAVLQVGQCYASATEPMSTLAARAVLAP